MYDRVDSGLNLLLVGENGCLTNSLVGDANARKPRS